MQSIVHDICMRSDKWCMYCAAICLSLSRNRYFIEGVYTTVSFPLLRGPYWFSLMETRTNHADFQRLKAGHLSYRTHRCAATQFISGFLCIPNNCLWGAEGYVSIVKLFHRHFMLINSINSQQIISQLHSYLQLLGATPKIQYGGMSCRCCALLNAHL